MNGRRADADPDLVRTDGRLVDFADLEGLGSTVPALNDRLHGP
jgi:hypothetical protein